MPVGAKLPPRWSLLRPVPSPATRPAQVLRVLAFNLAMLLGLLVLIEVVLRAAGVRYPAFYRPDRVRGYTLRPGASGLWTREGKGKVTINRDGLRDVDHNRQPAAGVLRVAVLGDSFSEALQVNLEATWWKQLEHLLNATPDCAFRQGYPGGVEMVNFGVGGYGTGLELLTWRQQAHAYAPRKVLLAMFLGNDIQDNTPQPRPDLPVFQFGPAGTLVIDNGFRTSGGSRFRFSPLGRFLDGVVDRSALLQLANEAKNRWASRRGPDPKPLASTPLPEQDDPKGWAMTGALLRSLREEVKAGGAELIVTSLSTPEQTWPDRAARQTAFLRAGLRPFAREERLSSVLAPLGVPYLPLAEELQQRADRDGVTLHGFSGQQPGYGHWNQVGHRLAAEALARRLCGKPSALTPTDQAAWPTP